MQDLMSSMPWATLVTVASGYSGYYVANIGVRDHHKTVDIAFTALVFGFFATCAYVLLLAIGAHVIVASLAAFAVAVACGSFWSIAGRRALVWCLRKLGVSHNDDLPTALDALVSETRTFAKQLSVKTDDNRWLICADLHAHAHLPNGPFVLGRSGDVLMYVTHVWDGTDADYVPCDGLYHATWGAEITYLPAGQVKRVDIRRVWKKPTSSSAGGAGP